MKFEERFEALCDIAMVDGHAHSLRRADIEVTGSIFRTAFSESRQRGILEDHLLHSLSYRDLLIRVCQTAFDDCQSDASGGELETFYLSKRAETEPASLNQRLLARANISQFLIDDGYGEDTTMLSLQELSQVLGKPVHRVLRIETELEDLLGKVSTIQAVLEGFQERVDADSSIRALKTIAAYRGGLELQTVTEAEARDELDFVKWRNKGGSTAVRLEGTKMHHYLLGEAFAVAREKQLPVQVHCGFGDSDLILNRANPAKMTAVFKEPRYDQVNFVLLHCFPYVKEAAYLASVFSSVHLDLSLAPIMVSPAMQQFYREALSVAPLSKIMAGTDGHSFPEAYFYGARSTRKGLAYALASLEEEGYLSEKEGSLYGNRILCENSQELYRL